MAFVEIDRFYDLPSGQVATSALRAAGIPAILQGVDIAGIIPVSIGWENGLRLRVPEEDVEAARAILDEAVPPDPDALNWGHHPEAQSSAPVALATFLGAMLSWPLGLGLVAQKMRQTWVTRIGLALFWAVMLLGLGGLLLQVWAPPGPF